MHLGTFLRELDHNPLWNLILIAKAVPVPIKYEIMRLSVLCFWITYFILCGKHVSVLFLCTCSHLCVCLSVFRDWLEPRVIEVLSGILAQRWMSKTPPEHIIKQIPNFLNILDLFRVSLDQVVNRDLLWVEVIFYLITFSPLRNMIDHRLY